MLKIRKATPEDVDVLHELILGIAKYHGQEKYVRTTKKKMVEAGFGSDPKFGALIAENKGDVAGYLSYTWNYSIWKGKHFMNIDDVFVWENQRGQKIGEHLMQEARKISLENGIKTIRWEVEKTNVRAIEFYKRLGAEIILKGIFRWNLDKK